MSQPEQDVQGIHTGVRSRGCESESMRRGVWLAGSEPKQGKVVPWQRVAFMGLQSPGGQKSTCVGEGVAVGWEISYLQGGISDK